MEAKLEELGRSFTNLETDFMRTGEIKARVRLEEIKSSVDKKRDEVQTRLQEVKKAGDSAVQETQEGAKAAWNELVEAVDRAKEELSELKS